MSRSVLPTLVLACALSRMAGAADLSPLESLAGAVSLGGSIEGGYSFFFPTGEGEDSGSLLMEPLLAASGQFDAGGFASWELRAVGKMSAETLPAKALATIGGFSGRLWVGPLSAELGYGFDAAPAAEVFPELSFLGPSDPLSFLASGGTRRDRLPEYFGKLSVTGGAFRASILVAPFHPPLALPNLASPWFPASAIPETAELGDGVYRRESLAWAAEEAIGNLEPSWIGRVGFAAGPVDLDLHWWRGRERNPAWWGVVSTPGTRSFAVLILPKRAVVEAYGLSSTAVFGQFRAWTEDVYVKGASLETGSYDFGGYGIFFRPGSVGALVDPPVVNRDRLGFTIGASYSPELRGLNLNCFVEGTWSEVLGAPARLPALSRALAMGLDASGILDRLGLGMGCLISLADWSFALRPTLSLGLGGEAQLGFSMPLFFGAESTELGAWSKRIVGTVSFQQHI